MNLKNLLPTFFKGMAMGMAEIVPGVSGGTIAFITGIYERLLNCIKSFSPKLISTAKNSGFSGVWKAIDGNFLLLLLTGMVVGIGVGITGITWLMENQPVPLWAFFFGLIIASIIYIFKQVDSWKPFSIVLVILGAIVAYVITIAAPASGNEALWFVFLSGAIAISALILPGISGSFILLLMGMYTYIIPLIKSALKTFDTSALITVGVFCLGCLTGLLTFARLLSWTFKNYKNPTLALLTGFMIGSLNKIWPWRKATQFTYDENGLPDKILQEINLLPSNYLASTGNDSQLILAISCGILGFILVFLLDKFSEK